MEEAKCEDVDLSAFSSNTVLVYSGCKGLEVRIQPSSVSISPTITLKENLGFGHKPWGMASYLYFLSKRLQKRSFSLSHYVIIVACLFPGVASEQIHLLFMASKL